jgi:hypothetical protein
MTFFLELRHGLVGIPVVQRQEAPVIKVPFASCKDLIARVLGAFSPVAGIVGDSATKLLDAEKNIDYAAFLDLVLKFYAGERVKRKTAVRLMVKSQKGGTGEMPIVLEVFVAMMQSLGFQGSIEQILEFYRYARHTSRGEITLPGVLQSMDDLNVHFYSLDIPLETDFSFDRSEGARQMVMAHWAKFGQWFDGLRKAATTLDTWVRSQLILQVRKVEQAFQLNLPAATLFAEYRSLLDLFQFFLGLLARGSPTPMKIEQSQEILAFLENLNENLLTFIIQTGNQQLKPQRR